MACPKYSVACHHWHACQWFAIPDLEHSIKKFWEIENVEIDSVKTTQVCLYYGYRENVSHDKHTPGANVFAKNSVEERHRRTNKNVRVNYSHLRTVSAPYLATRTLKPLAMDEANNFPLAAPVVMSDCYMDDILSGSESIEEVIELQHQLIEMFKTAGMHLHKWCGNLPEITSNLQEYAILESDETKALGII
ncbi:uncharacterized protein TNCV_3748841 [Trichonephila clavipes]|nr:uncharacterized protein TNCV_3748841 [Trichonephila clavipes]